jgi:zinc/manganese transport system substrate-binding protein
MRAILSLVVAGALLAAACGGGDADGRADDRPDVVVTTTILGDVVREVAGDAADVTVILPIGADPHEFSASARQVEAMSEADLLVVNGAGFEGNLLDAVERSGPPVFAFTDHVELLQRDGNDDPHFWTDPRRMATAVDALAGALADAGIYVGGAADRYGFDVVGAVVPSLTTGAAASAAGIEALADAVRRAGAPAIFAETTSSTELAAALADAAGDDVAVVELYTESLGPSGSGADTYVGLLRTDAQLIHDALV